MKLKQIHRDVRAALKLEQDKAHQDDPRANILGVPAIKTGHKNDADMVLIVLAHEGTLLAGLSVGGSVCFGAEIIEVLTEYLRGDKTRALKVIDDFVIKSSHYIREQKPYVAIIRSASSVAWRSYQPVDGDKLMPVDEIRQRAKFITALPTAPNPKAERENKQLVNELLAISAAAMVATLPTPR